MAISTHGSFHIESPQFGATPSQIFMKFGIMISSHQKLLEVKLYMFMITSREMGCVIRGCQLFPNMNTRECYRNWSFSTDRLEHMKNIAGDSPVRQQHRNLQKSIFVCPLRVAALFQHEIFELLFWNVWNLHVWKQLKCHNLETSETALALQGPRGFETLGWGMIHYQTW